MLSFREWLAEQEKLDKKPEISAKERNETIDRNEQEIKSSDDIDTEVDDVKKSNTKVEEDDGSVSSSDGTTSADVATVDNKIDIVSRSLHKKLTPKEIENSLIPTEDKKEEV